MTEQSKDLDAAMRQYLDDELLGAGMQDGRSDNPLPPPEPEEPSGGGSPGAPTPAAFRNSVAEIASTVLKIPPDRLDVRENMSRYGVDSIIVTEIMKRISDLLGLPVAPTVFFEARHLEELADILYRRYGRNIVERGSGAGSGGTVSASVRSVPHDPAPLRETEAPTAQPRAEIGGDAAGWIERFRAIAAAGPRQPCAAGPEPEPPAIAAAAGRGGYEPVAIIAMEGTFAESADLQEFEKHLREGDDCIREVPPDRWDWRQVYGDPRQGEFTNVKYGGFAPDIDRFDPLFFGMSPREAELMDPQHRLFIQCVWKLIESAGYAPKSLSGRKIGMFIGINLQDYAHLVDRSGAMEALHLTSLGHMFCPNRLSFYLDIHGPSQVIDTACSSSLVALHRAVMSVQHEGCEMAVAGGANLLISPDMHIMYSKVGMICEDGRCKTFSERANGYVRGDGVGAVLLKPLSHAERDGDTILAVIRGSAENHGGMSTSLTAPNPKAQASLIAEAHRRAGIDPRTVGYIECHGTGTSLGDPIEINGLKMAFEELHRDAGVDMPEAPYCGLGSVKSNIGHAETAAGIAGAIKAVLAIRNRRLYPTLHCGDLNPMIELEGSPFFIAGDGAEWRAPVVDGREQPRRAGVSSFGAGGSNAHVVIEEYTGRRAGTVEAGAPSLILLSARTEARLAAVVDRMLRFLNETPEPEIPDIADIAYTLQAGRDAMAERLAFVAGTAADLKATLGRIAAGGEPGSDVYRGTVRRGREAAAGSDLAEFAPSTAAERFSPHRLRELAALWTGGASIDWPALYAETEFPGRRPRRVGLPTYPFARQRCWLPEGTAVPRDRRGGRSAGTEAILHPLVHRDVSDETERRFSSVFNGEEFFLSDHIVMGDRILPGVAYLEIARAAVRQAGAEMDRERIGIRLRNVVWARPFAVGDRAATLYVALAPAERGRVAYRIYSLPEEREGAPVLHSQGTALVQDPSSADAPAGLDVGALRDAVTGGLPEQHRLSGEECYVAFGAMGIAYGPGQRGLDTVYFSPPGTDAPQVLAKLVLPAAGHSAAASFVLHPGLMDSALQACIGLMKGAGHALPAAASAAGADGLSASLPFALDEFELLARPPATLWAWIRSAAGASRTDRLQKLDIDLCDEAGLVCVRMRGFSSRTPEQVRAPAGNATLLCRPVWVRQPAAGAADDPVWSTHRVLICDPGGFFPETLEREIAAKMPGATCSRLRLGGTVADRYADAAIGVFEAVREEFARKGAGRTLVQLVVPARGDGLLGGLAGLLRTANREGVRVSGQLVEIDCDDAGSGIVAEIAAGIAAESRHPGEEHVRRDRSGRQVLRWRECERPAAQPAVPWKDRGVYLIVGGGGGLGLLFADEISIHARNATVVLCGRSEPEPERAADIDRLSAAGLDVRYRQLDVGSREAVDALVAEIVESVGRIDGVLHCAAVLSDNFILRKSAQEFRDVLAPKVAGTLHLDGATADIDLDFFALFSSAAGAWGSAGQADYAAANGFMDVFAHRRNELVRRGERRGHTVSIDWPLWADGGIRMEAGALAMMRQSTGMEALPREDGVRAFHDILASGASQMLVLHGSPDRLRRMLASPRAGGAAAGDVIDAGADAAVLPAFADTGEWQSGIERMLLQTVAALMKFEPEDLDVESEWSDYGFDSITFTELSNRLNERFPLDLAPTVFFEYPTIAEFAAWLAGEHGPLLAEALDLRGLVLPASRTEEENKDSPDVAATDRTVAGPELPAARAAMDRPTGPGREFRDDAVAIVGMSGRFPMAKDLDAFWSNLLEGKDCITEIPADRWDWQAIYGDPAVEPNRSNVKWGGFIEGVGNFDARFFSISPREAETMDPQQRFLMQYAWKAMEDAGYSAGALSGSNTAIFVGTAPSGYGEMMAQNGSVIESYSSTGAVGSIGPNRMSYFLNVHGPSEPIETACSSALVAIHRGVAAIANGDCDQAIVGGINLIVSPETHISFNKAGMLSPDGRSKPFSKDANGYGRGEGVGMLFLKKLSAAEQAGDHVYGVIRSSAVNHGGRGNSLTAPNPKAQAELLRTAYARAGFDPRSVGYIEAHGTGTALGDPIEIRGLKAAFADMYRSAGAPDAVAAHCGLGSVKSNIGHLELAAGVAGVIKVLLQMKHRTLVRSLHCDEVNPYIQLEGSPFYLVRENREWTPQQDDEGRELPRRAGVSSFGFGGVNAHVVIEEYLQAQPETDAADRTGEPELPSLVVLSAKNKDRLKAYARDLLAFVAAGAPSPGPAARTAAGRAEQVLTEKALAIVADLLGVDPDEIDPAHPLDEYGFDTVHRTILGSRLEAELGLEIAAKPLIENLSVAAVVAGVLAHSPVLRDRLGGDTAPSDRPSAPANDRRATGRPGFRIADLAYTLQVGREPMTERLAVVAGSLEELAARLSAFVEDRSEGLDGVFAGEAGQNREMLAAFGADEDLQEALDKWVRRGKFSRLLGLWVKGVNLDWGKLYGEAGPYRSRPRRISAPGYPFAEQRYWMEPQPAVQARPAVVSGLHPLLHENVSTLQRVRFSALFDGTEFFLADHRMQGRKVLPGVAYLEMARAAVARAGMADTPAGAVCRLRDVVWIRPAVIDGPQRMDIDLVPDADGAVRFEVSSETADGGSDDPTRQVHSQGLVSVHSAAVPPPLDPAAMLARAGLQRLDVGQCYELFGAAGLDYGPGHRGIGELHAGDGQVLARLTLPGSIADTLDSYVLHPSLMDSALQASIGLSMGAGPAPADGPGLSVPFAVETVDVFGACVATMWAWVRRAADSQQGGRLQKLDIDLCDDGGRICVQIRGFSSRIMEAARAPAASAPVSAVAPPERTHGAPDTLRAPMRGAGKLPESPQSSVSMDRSEIRTRTIAYFKELLSAALKFPVDEIRADEALDSYGIDSMMVMELTGALERPFGPLSKTLFFEYRTLGELVDHFVDAHRPQLLELFDAGTPVEAIPDADRGAIGLPEPPRAVPGSFSGAEAVAGSPPAAPASSGTGALDIAVIGLSGRYPQARDVEEYWRNLRDGRDCITEVPEDRWDWRDYYSADRTEQDRHYCKWGGFIADVDKFDPLFFNVSPSAAEYMDPQERLFLEHAWMAMEDAGYRREDLQKPLGTAQGDDGASAQVGVYAGVMYGEYQLLGLEAKLAGRDLTLGNFYASIANRVSYALNLHGPSMAVDTMCSSSLTAIHLACQDLKQGNTDLALAGGVNLNLHPNKYGLLSTGQFISSSGKCESFGAGGDGYVPGEGVGLVFLKRLADAERDGDHIYGVIKSSALNHGGRTNGYSVPNPRAQQMVIDRAIRQAGIDPRAIGYVEAHGTGTKLGDPIEVAGLSRAFARHAAPGHFCWIGSSKSNIGHSEAAAGIAGLTKVLLQMREGRIAPSLHSGTLNPNIDFSNTPFQVNQDLRDWPRPMIEDRPHRRAAGISSFGAGGANAHLVVEEYVGRKRDTATRRPEETEMPCLVVLSARTEQQLGQYAESLLEFVRDRQAEAGGVLSLRDIAYTLQVGREEMPYRFGFVASSLTELSDGLARFVSGDRRGLHVGRAKPGSDGRVPAGEAATAVSGHIAVQDPGDLLASWVRGANVDWPGLYAGDDEMPLRVSLPTYPFARERYWILDAPASSGRAVPERSLPPAVTARAPDLSPDTGPTGPQAGGADTLTMKPVWTPKALSPVSPSIDYVEHIVLSAGGLPTIPGATCIALESAGGAADQCFTDYAVQLFGIVGDIFRRRPAGPVLLQVVTGADEASPGLPDGLVAALAGILKTARMENPQFAGQTIGLDADGAGLQPGELAAMLRANGQAPDELQVRYRQGTREVLTWADLNSAAAPALPVWRQGGVYLITGGAGGLGLAFAREIVRHVGDATVILTGRSRLDEARRAAIEALRGEGARVEYRSVDVSDRKAVHDLVRSIEEECRRSQRRGLSGIIHSAGIIRDNFILKKTASELRDVLAAKVSGVVNLDLVSRSLDLDFFVLFSSLAGVTGNPGQSDYASANAFLDGYAEYRNRLAEGAATETDALPRPRGRTLSIDWPLWEEGGMDIDSRAKEMMWRTVGLRPLRTDRGIAGFYRGLESGCDRVMVLQGDVPRLRALFPGGEPAAAGADAGPARSETLDDPPGGEVPEIGHRPAGDTGDLARRTEGLITGLLSEMLRMPAHRIEADVPLEEYGIDSVAMMKLTGDLEKLLGPLSKTLFFEYPTVEAVSAHLAGSHAGPLATLLEPAPPAESRQAPDVPPALRAPVAEQAPVAEAPASNAGRPPVAVSASSAGSRDIAVVGMSGRFPMAGDLDEFWRNLAGGKDCITEVPAERWDHVAYFDPDRNRIGKSYCKWGGFMEGVDRFDAAFFRISPGEAQLLDPQERLFLETVWNLLESSGYLGETLRGLESRVGVFVGSMSQQYHAFEADFLRESLVALSSPSSIANRVSYYFNFQGPSLAVDTMCSSSLNAVHMACESLLKGECRLAVAGGVNLTIHPKKYVALSAGQMVGSHPDSTSFGDGDGYLPAEGVGAVLLKPLADAIADGDEVLAVIRSTAVNHGGQSNGYRVPNGAVQADLIAENFAAAGIDPRTVTYVESAANGSPLGDAIELKALAAGFARYTDDRQFCAIGSVKSNIGHAEAASGMSQLIKVILQLQHRQIAPTIKAQPLNPNIAFEQTPFYLQRELGEWVRPVIALGGGEPAEYPRRATVSSFGAGGSNAHLILEEYDAGDGSVPLRRQEDVPQLVLLSARTAERLRALAERMAEFLGDRPDMPVADVAYTLQIAREAMEYRLALVVESREQLIGALRTWLQNGAADVPALGIFAGNSEEDNSDIRQLLSGRTGQSMLEYLLAERDLDKLALYWVKGAKIAWQAMHAAGAAHRVRLPTYPFDRRSHWLGDRTSPEAESAPGGEATFAVDGRQSQRENIERYLVQGLGRLLGSVPGELSPTGNFQDYGADSISLMRLQRGLEDVFGIRLQARDVFSCQTLAALAELAASRHAEESVKKKRL